LPTLEKFTQQVETIELQRQKKKIFHNSVLNIIYILYIKKKTKIKTRLDPRL